MAASFPVSFSSTAVLLTAAFLVGVSPAAAQTKVFHFSAKPEYHESHSVQNSLQVRPNSSVPFYVFIKTKDEYPVAHVELWTGGKLWLKSAPLQMTEANKVYRVTFPKAEAPAKPAAPAPAPVAPANAPPPPPPPPPGRLFESSKTFQFELRLYETREGKVDTTPKITEPITIEVLHPNRYLKVDATAQGSGISVVVSVPPDDQTAKNAFLDGNPSVVTLVFPPQDNLDVRALSSGTYRRTLTGPTKTITLEALDLPLNRSGDSGRVRFYVEADGYPRAFIYTPNLRDLRTSDRNPVQLNPDKAVRIYPGDVAAESPTGTYYARPVAKPEDRLPVRVELDNPDATSSTSVHFARFGEGSGEETGRLQGPRDTRVWVEPAGEEGQFLVTNKLTDWVTPLDTYQLRGPYQVTVEFDKLEKQSVRLNLDDTPARSISFQLHDEHVKGTALQVAAMVMDSELTPIRRVIFTLGPPPGPDGKRAAEPIKVEGLRDPDKVDLWHAAIPLPPEVKGVLEVGAVATNQVGLESTEVKLIKLVDPPPVGGTLVVTVLRGGRPQAKVNVLLRDAEGKEKGILATDDKGIATFKGLAPGMYSVLAAKADSSTGSRATMAAKVEPGDPVKVELNLKRGP
jgi:hypothetical protein